MCSIKIEKLKISENKIKKFHFKILKAKDQWEERDRIHRTKDGLNLSSVN